MIFFPISSLCLMVWRNGTINYGWKSVHLPMGKGKVRWSETGCGVNHRQKGNRTSLTSLLFLNHVAYNTLILFLQLTEYMSKKMLSEMETIKGKKKKINTSTNAPWSSRFSDLATKRSVSNWTLFGKHETRARDCPDPSVGWSESVSSEIIPFRWFPIFLCSLDPSPLLSPTRWNRWNITQH